MLDHSCGKFLVLYKYFYELLQLYIFISESINMNRYFYKRVSIFKKKVQVR